MENQKKPLLIKPSMAMDFLCAFAKFVQNSHTYHKKPVKSFANLGKVNARLR